MKNCSQCNTSQEDDAHFCSHCGAPFSVEKKEEYKVDSDDLIKTVKKLFHESNVRRILIKDEKGNRLLEIPVSIGIIGAVFAPWLAALGAIAAIATNCTIEVIRVDD